MKIQHTVGASESNTDMRKSNQELAWNHIFLLYLMPPSR